MKRLIRGLPLPVKLVLLGAVPLMFLLVLAFLYNQQKNERLETLDAYRQRITQVADINSLIDALQMERRYSFGFLERNEWLNELQLQRARTDEILQRLSPQEKRDSTSLTAYTFLNQLDAFREQVDRKQVAPLVLVNYFTNAIFRLSNLNMLSAGNVTFLRPVLSSLEGQKIMSDIITYEGIVLFQVYGALEAKANDPQLVASVIQLQEIIGTFVQEFKIKAPAHRVRQFNALLQDPAIQNAAEMVESIRANNAFDTSISSEFWWSTLSQAIDKLKVLQRGMIEEGRFGIDTIYEQEVTIRNWSLALLVAALLFTFYFIYLTIRLITTRLTELRTAAGMLALGQTGLRLHLGPDDAIGALSRSITDIDRNNQTLADTARRIGSGDFEVTVQPRSEADVLGNALVQMKDGLQDYARLNAHKLWIQGGVTGLNDALRGDKDPETISREALDFLCTYLGCESGLCYLAGNGHLRLSAGYAISSRASVPKELAMGETLIGQAAQQKEIRQLSDVPEAFLQIRSGLVSAAPRHLLLLPLVQDEAVEGVLELASLRTFAPHQVDLLKEVSNDIAIALRSAHNKQQLQQLFEQTQAQAEELQAQHSELENINAELEAQTEKLQASEEELKVQQEELLQANSELEERSRLLEERNALIVERNLEIQQKAEELELSTRYKSEFLANMSHELRTPLNSILLLSRLLSENNEHNLSGEQVEYAQVIQSSGQGLLSLIDEILDLSKIEAGRMELEYGSVGLQEILQDMRALFTPVAREKGIELKVEADPQAPTLIETDKLRLEQVLRNLLSNALKFTAQGSVEMTVSPLRDKDDFLCFSVKDTGIGIPRDKQALIFEAFQQADGSTRRKYGGTGLGLSISRELVRLMGGEIKVSSEPGQGSEFSVYLPRDRAAAAIRPAETPAGEDADAAEALPPARPAATRSLRTDLIPESLPDDRAGIGNGDKSILIIEDDTAFARALLDFTRKKGYKALVAVRGDEGIALARQFRPEGVLLDIQLPVKDGWEVMDELKSDPATRHIPVHIMSSLEARRESLMKGAVDFINKPVAFEQMQEVFRKIEQALNREHKKVLIVEENPRHAQALAYFLENFNVSAQISATVRDSVEALQREEVNCVILDMGIPDQHAYETLEAVKQNPGLEHLPIIIFTGKNLSKTEESRIKQYADSIVVKTAHSYQRILDEVSLFLHLVEEQQKPDRPARYRRLGELHEVLGGKKVLVTDDDVRNIFSLTKALELHNMQVVSAMDGREALKKLEEHPDIDAVLMDIMMPEMDGYEAIQAIRSKPAHRQLPVIAITAKAMTGDREKCIRAGASDYISKPVDIDQLLSLLRVWLYDKSI